MSTVTRPNDQEISRDVLPPRLPAVGMIKLGIQKPGTEGGRGKTPQKIDFFRVTTRVREKGVGNFLLDEDVHAKVGAKPTVLDIRLPFDRASENFYAQLVQYSGQTRVAQCDGSNVLDLNTGVTETCLRKKGRSCPCKPYGRLGVILEAAPTFGGLYVLRTTSWESVNSIQTALKMFEGQFGSLRGLPLRMRLYPAEVRYKQGGQEKTATAYKVAIELRATYDEARDAALEYHRRHQIARREILQLASGTSESLGDLDAADAPDINDEFFPGSATASAAPSGLSRVGEINRRLAAGGDPDEADPPVQDAEIIEESGDPIDEAIERCTALLTEATERGILSAPQIARVNEAIEGRDETNLRMSTDWLRGQLVDHEQESGS